MEVWPGDGLLHRLEFADTNQYGRVVSQVRLPVTVLASRFFIIHASFYLRDER